MSGSLSQDNIQVNDKTPEDSLFKNKLLLQSLQQGDNKLNASIDGKMEEDQKRKEKEELEKVLEQKRLVEEKLKTEQETLTKLVSSQKGNGFKLVFHFILFVF